MQNNSHDCKTNYYAKQASSVIHTHDTQQRPLTEAVVQAGYNHFEKKMLLEAHSRLKSSESKLVILHVEVTRQLYIIAKHSNCLEDTCLSFQAPIRTNTGSLIQFLLGIVI